MPVIIACPSCGGKLRITDALRGQRVRCPACNTTFESSAESSSLPPSPAAGLDLPLQLSLDDSSSPPSVSGPQEWTETDERDLVPEEEPAAPPRARTLPPRSLPIDPYDDRDGFDIHRSQPRRDAEPDRGAIILALGIISITLVMTWCIAPVGAILGLVAWVMGQRDLGKIRSGRMDASGRGMTQAGWICGIIGAILNLLITLSCGGGFAYFWYQEMNSLPNTRPVPAPKTAPLPPMKKMPAEQP